MSADARVMHVAMVSRTTILDGGVPVHIARSAAALRSVGCQVTLITGSAGAGDADALVLPEMASGVLGSATRAALCAAVARCGAQVVHLHDIGDDDLVQSLRPLAGTVVSAHGWAGCASNKKYFGSGRECHRTHGPACISHMLLDNCTHQWDPLPIPAYYRQAGARLRALDGADVAVAYSSAVCRHLRANGVRSVRQVRLPIAIPAAPPPRASGPARVVFVGRLGAQKGVDVLLRSARHFDAHIDVIGDGWARPRLERLTRRLRLDERVTFHGWCDAATISQAYANARAAVVPSTWPEPFGMVGPEAMVHARPVVASSTGGVSDWLTDAEAGYLVPPGDPRALGEAIARLLASPARAHEMGLAGRRLVADRFTDSAHVRDLLPVYTSVLLDEGATPRA